MTFGDRGDAGRRLVAPVADLGETNPVVLGIARGGVLVARELADGLGVPCDVAVVRKVVVLEVPVSFRAVGEWYRDFGQATDEDVVAALGREAA